MAVDPTRRGGRVAAHRAPFAALRMLRDGNEVTARGMATRWKTLGQGRHAAAVRAAEDQLRRHGRSATLSSIHDRAASAGTTAILAAHAHLAPVDVLRRIVLGSALALAARDLLDGERYLPRHHLALLWADEAVLGVERIDAEATRFRRHYPELREAIERSAAPGTLLNLRVDRSGANVGRHVGDAAAAGVRIDVQLEWRPTWSRMLRARVPDHIRDPRIVEQAARFVQHVSSVEASNRIALRGDTLFAWGPIEHGRLGALVAALTGLEPGERLMLEHVTGRPWRRETSIGHLGSDWRRDAAGRPLAPRPAPAPGPHDAAAHEPSILVKRRMAEAQARRDERMAWQAARLDAAAEDRLMLVDGARRLAAMQGDMDFEPHEGLPRIYRFVVGRIDDTFLVHDVVSSTYDAARADLRQAHGRLRRYAFMGVLPLPGMRVPRAGERHRPTTSPSR